MWLPFVLATKNGVKHILEMNERDAEAGVFIASLAGRSGGESGEDLQHLRLPDAHERRASRQQLHPAGAARGAAHSTRDKLFLPLHEQLLPAGWRIDWDCVFIDAPLTCALISTQHDGVM